MTEIGVVLLEGGGFVPPRQVARQLSLVSKVLMPLPENAQRAFLTTKSHSLTQIAWKQMTSLLFRVCEYQLPLILFGIERQLNELAKKPESAMSLTTR